MTHVVITYILKFIYRLIVTSTLYTVLFQQYCIYVYLTKLGMLHFLFEPKEFTKSVCFKFKCKLNVYLDVCEYWHDAWFSYCLMCVITYWHSSVPLNQMWWSFALFSQRMSDVFGIYSRSPVSRHQVARSWAACHVRLAEWFLFRMVNNCRYLKHCYLTYVAEYGFCITK